MSVLAHALLDRGATVSGSDASDSPALAGLRARGVAGDAWAMTPGTPAWPRPTAW